MRTIALSEWMQGLESRVLLAGDLPVEVYYPEGFAHPGISEAVEIVSLADVDVEFELLARYERGPRDQVLASGTIAPGETEQIQISDPDDPDAALVRLNAPYALVLQSDGELLATFFHSDFGGETAESFTSELATSWAFPDAEKHRGTARDFIVFYNPAETAVQVTLTGVGQSGRIFTVRQTVEGLRRGGWNLQRTPAAPAGEYGIVVTSSHPIVAALSHYDLNEQDGSMGTLGAQDGGAKAGVVFTVEFNDKHNGRTRDPFTETTFALMNAEDVAVDVTLVFLNRDGDPPADNIHTISLQAESRVTVRLSRFGFEDTESLSLVYRAESPVVVGATVSRQNQAYMAGATTIGADEWTLTNPDANRIRNGQERSDELFVFNPGLDTLRVELEYFRANGDTVTETVSVDHLGFSTIDISDLPPNDDGDGPPIYGVRVLTTAPVVVGMQYWSKPDGSGFSVDGLAGGNIADLYDVLVLRG